MLAMRLLTCGTPAATQKPMPPVRNQPSSSSPPVRRGACEPAVNQSAMSVTLTNAAPRLSTRHDACR